MPVHLREIVRAPDNSTARSQGSTQPNRVAPVWQITLFGRVALHAGEREVVLNSRKAKALLAYLALTPSGRETRDHLVGLLWSETESDKARASLRQLLHGLHKTFEAECLFGLSIDNSSVSLDKSAFLTDLDSAGTSIDRGDPADALVNEPRITDTLLCGYEDVDPRFGAWLTAKRERVRQNLIRRLEAQLCLTPRRVEAVKRLAHALSQVDPTHELACQQVMCACIASGNIGGALAAYKKLWECLEQEYDLEPSKATQELIVAIRSGAHQRYIGTFDAVVQISAAADQVVHPINNLAMAGTVT